MVRLILKRILLAVGVILTSPLIILTRLEEFIAGEKCERILMSCKEIVSLCPTFIGEYMRLAYYWAVCKSISPDACFLLGSMVAHRDTVIRAGTVVGAYTIIGYADIGENVLFGAGVSLISGKYQHGRPQERVASEIVTEKYDRISIGRNSWIGQESVIMANIGENCTIGAGSVVYKDVPDNSTFMGNPARKVNVEPNPSAKEM